MAAMPAPSPQYNPYALSDGHPAFSVAAQSGIPNMQALNLPPIRSGDGGPQTQLASQQPPPPPQQQQQQQQQSGQIPQHYYLTPGQPFPAQPGDMMRYGSIPIPPADSRIMSGGRHKKEIKRRTKTGCLTCRKRRIKCDEQHPTCRNCQKSKRECLGYDPIFKPQPGPPPIQPALGGGGPMHHPSQHPTAYPPGYAAGYPYPPHPVASENSTSENNNYTTSIDPALNAAMAQAGEGGGTDAGGHRAKRTKIEELQCINGFPPPPPPPSTTILESSREQIKVIWSTVYAPGIDKFLETTWYVARGESYLHANQPMCEQFVNLINRFQILPQHDPNYPLNLAATYSLEAKMVWELISMSRTAANANKTSDAPETPADPEDVKHGVTDAAKRVDTLEALITGEYLSPEDPTATHPPPSSDPTKPNGTALGDQLKTRETHFWQLIHTFLTIRDDEASAAKEIDDTISTARSLLDSRENRDVIYSIMIARHIGARIAEFPDNMPQATSNEEADDKNKLHVAKRFIEDEANGKGTNQIVQRVSGMAARSWSQQRR